MFENEWFVRANEIGISWCDFWDMNPRIITLMNKAYEKKIKRMDELVWASVGNYFLTAVSVAVDRCLNGKKSKSSYVENPMLKDLGKNDGLTEEEIEEIEIRKLIEAEEQWIRVSREKGLPETVIK